VVLFTTLTTAVCAIVGSVVATEPASAHAAWPAALHYVSPLPDSRLVSPATGIIARFASRSDPALGRGASFIRVTGSLSGPHAGRLRLSDDGRTWVFTPDQPFAWGESVTATIAPATGDATFAFAYDFRVASAPVAGDLRSQDLDELGLESAGSTFGPAVMSYRPGTYPLDDSLPPDFPVLASTVYEPTSPGALFLSNISFGPPNDPYLLIVDNFGTPIFFRRMPGNCFDFKMQPNGLMTYFDGTVDHFFAMDASYTIVDSFATGNGYITDLHELRLLPNGHALMLSYDAEPVDMSAIVEGGNPSATVLGLIVQEIDTDKQVVFEWRSWDHFQITDATHENLTSARIDYVHGNAIEVDADGDLIISSRHMDEITKISRETGDILWRWGGKHNEFTFLGDTLQFSHQHAIRRIANGHFTLFDNGNFHDPSFSRAMEYDVDPTAHTATAVWEYRHQPDTYGLALGYVERFDNGNTLIAWGAGKPDVSEVAPDGSVLMEMNLAAGIFSYRTLRFDVSPSAGVSLAGVSSRLLGPVVPNPISARARVALVMPSAGRVSATVFDITGRKVLTLLDRQMVAEGRHSLDVDLTGHSAGLYVLRVQTPHGVEARKLVLAH
jgi:hypothetical protein